MLGGERDGAVAGDDVGQRDRAPLGLGDDLVRDDEHVAVDERAGRLRQQRGEVVAGADLGDAGQRDGGDHERSSAS